LPETEVIDPHFSQW